MEERGTGLGIVLPTQRHQVEPTNKREITTAAIGSLLSNLYDDPSPPWVYISICPSFSVCLLSVRSVCLSIYVCLSVRLFVCLSIYVCFSACSSSCPSSFLCLSVCLSPLPFFPSVCLSVFLSASASPSISLSCATYPLLQFCTKRICSFFCLGLSMFLSVCLLVCRSLYLSSTLS